MWIRFHELFLACQDYVDKVPRTIPRWMLQFGFTRFADALTLSASTLSTIHVILPRRCTSFFIDDARHSSSTIHVRHFFSTIHAILPRRSTSSFVFLHSFRRRTDRTFRLWCILIVVKHFVALYLTNKGDHTTLYKINKNVYMKSPKQKQKTHRYDKEFINIILYSSLITSAHSRTHARTHTHTNTSVKR